MDKARISRLPRHCANGSKIIPSRSYGFGKSDRASMRARLLGVSDLEVDRAFEEMESAFERGRSLRSTTRAIGSAWAVAFMTRRFLGRAAVRC
jgi:hypothetical protein